MNGNIIREFLVGLGFQVDEQGLNNFTSGITTATVAVTAIGTAAVAAAGYISKFVLGIANEMDDIGDLGERVNATASEIAQLGYVATLTDSSMGSVASTLDQLNKSAGDAFMGIGRTKKIFEELGISVAGTDGKLKNTTAILGEVSDKIKGMEKGQQIAILSRLGIDPTMLGMLTKDVSEIVSKHQKLYADLGMEEDESVKKAGELVDAQLELGLVSNAIQQKLAIMFMGPVKKGLTEFTKFLYDNAGKIVKAIAPIINVIFKIAEAFIGIAVRIGQFVGYIIDKFNQLNDATDGWAGYVLALAVAWKYVNALILASPVGIVLSLAAAIALLVDDYMTWQEKGKSFIDWSKWKEEIDAAKSVINGFKDFLKNTFTAIIATVDIGVKLSEGDIAGAKFAAKELLNSIVNLFKTKGDTEIFAGMAEEARGILEKIKGYFSEKIENFKNNISSIVAVVVSVLGTIKSLFMDSLNYVTNLFERFKTTVLEKIQAIKSGFSGIGEAIKSAFTGVINFVIGLFDRLIDKVVFAVTTIKKAVASIKGSNVEPIPMKKILGTAASNVVSITSKQGGSELKPSQQTASNIKNSTTTQSISQKTDIHVTGSSNPETTAKAVAAKQSTVNADLARNFKGVVR